MRLKLFAIGMAAAVLLSGCQKVTKEQGLKAFHKELHLYFNNLNNEAQFRKDEMRKNDAKLGLVTPTGSIYSTYLFDETAFIVKNFKCKTCETKLIVTSPGTEYLCPTCGHCPYVKHEGTFNKKESPCKTCLGPDGKPREPNADLIKKEAFEASGAQVLPMFEFAAGKDNPNATMVATVRYVRRQWAYDGRGVVDISSRVVEKAAVDPSWLPIAAVEGGMAGRAPGFHRLDATYVGEIEFEFRGGDLAVKSRRVEEAVRPWKDLKGNQ
jgi:predicted RNA-binding Zn-ribbon protein involved in translation (DUF1610 family)